MNRIAIVITVLCASCAGADAYAREYALNQAVTQSTINLTICVPGWSETIRPPTSYTNRLKKRQLPAGFPMSDYEEDHIIPLGLGGHPTDPKNLQPQLWFGKCGARRKDVDERRLHSAVCAGTSTLAAAQQFFMPWGCR